MLQTISKFNTLFLAFVILLSAGTFNNSKVDARNSQNLTQLPASNIIAAAPEWKQFLSDEGKFSILMPDKEILDMTPSKESILPGIQTIKLNATMKDNSVFLAGYADFDINLNQFPSNEILDSFLQGMLEGKTNLLSQKNIQLGQYQGKEVKIQDETKGITYNSRVFLVGQRIYILMVGGTKTPQTSDTQKFFNSFQLIQ